MPEVVLSHGSFCLCKNNNKNQEETRSPCSPVKIVQNQQCWCFYCYLTSTWLKGESYNCQMLTIVAQQVWDLKALSKDDVMSSFTTESPELTLNQRQMWTAVLLLEPSSDPVYQGLNLEAHRSICALKVTWCRSPRLSQCNYSSDLMRSQGLHSIFPTMMTFFPPRRKWRLNFLASSLFLW